jgi:hypothetical protein
VKSALPEKQKHRLLGARRGTQPPSLKLSTYTHDI